MKIQIIIDNKTSFKTPVKKEIQEAILAVFKKKKIDPDIKVEIGLKIVTQKEIQKLNLKFRKIDQPTDVLSFPIYDHPPKKSPEIILLGDIVICPDILEQNAQENSITTKTEFIKLVSHSTLHLLGYHHS